MSWALQMVEHAEMTSAPINQDGDRIVLTPNDHSLGRKRRASGLVMSMAHLSTAPMPTVCLASVTIRRTVFNASGDLGEPLVVNDHFDGSGSVKQLNQRNRAYRL